MSPKIRANSQKYIVGRTYGLQSAVCRIMVNVILFDEAGKWSAACAFPVCPAPKEAPDRISKGGEAITADQEERIEALANCKGCSWTTESAVTLAKQGSKREPAQPNPIDYY